MSNELDINQLTRLAMMPELHKHIPESKATGHTPGPWKLTKEYGQFDTHFYLEPAFNPQHNRNQDQHNARLIEQAPTLLQALESIAQELTERNCLCSDVEHMANCVAKARAAITKAKGD